MRFEWTKVSHRESAQLHHPDTALLRGPILTSILSVPRDPAPGESPSPRCSLPPRGFCSTLPAAASWTAPARRLHSPATSSWPGFGRTLPRGEPPPLAHPLLQTLFFMQRSKFPFSGQGPGLEAAAPWGAVSGLTRIRRALHSLRAGNLVRSAAAEGTRWSHIQEGVT